MIGVLHAPQRRSTEIANAMLMGLRRIGEAAELVPAEDYRRAEWPVVTFYGLGGNLGRAFAHYSANPNLTVVYVDLGYWQRKWPTFWEGHHKISVNSRHTTAYFQRVAHPRNRIEALRHTPIRPQPWRQPTLSDPVLLAGMGDKAAAAEGMTPGTWERRAIKKLRRYTEREIIYRPKPSWKGAEQIPGALYSGPDEPLTPLLRRCHAVVTHHSNVAVDGLVEGVPAFTVKGVAMPLGLTDTAWIEQPYTGGDRDQWLADVAYCQWSVPEMRAGTPWLHLKSEGLVP